MVVNGAANRDPAPASSIPTEFQVERANARQHLAFGHGPHTCPGAPLARAEGRITVERLLDRMGDIRISEAEHGPAGARRYEYVPTYILRGLTRLHLEWTTNTPSRAGDRHMIMSIVRHPIRAKYADEWPELAAEFTTATRAEPGNICFDWFRSVDDPNLYLLVEMFRDRAAGDAHVNSEHFKAAMGQMGHAYRGMPEVVHVEVSGEGWSAMAEVEDAAADD